jgi:hypothetical protein
MSLAILKLRFVLSILLVFLPLPLGHSHAVFSHPVDCTSFLHTPARSRSLSLTHSLSQSLTLTLSLTHITQGNWYIGDHSYMLEDIAALRVDGTDLLETEAERSAAREKRARKKNRKHRHSVFGGWGRTGSTHRVQRDSPGITRRPAAVTPVVEQEVEIPLRRSRTDPTLDDVEAIASTSAGTPAAVAGRGKNEEEKKNKNKNKIEKSAQQEGENKKNKKKDREVANSQLGVSKSAADITQLHKEKKSKKGAGPRIRKSGSKQEVSKHASKEAKKDAKEAEASGSKSKPGGKHTHKKHHHQPKGKV